MDIGTLTVDMVVMPRGELIELIDQRIAERDAKIADKIKAAKAQPPTGWWNHEGTITAAMLAHEKAQQDAASRIAADISKALRGWSVHVDANGLAKLLKAEGV